MPTYKYQKVIVIVGPTASGKSNLGIKLAKKYNGEIISADSRQVYRGMNLGTGKVLRDKTFPVSNVKFKYQNEKFKNGDFYSEGIRHHLIDVVAPKKRFTANDFKKLGEKAIKEILAKGKIPIIVGGTGFYIDVFLGRMQTAQVPPNLKLRARFDKLTTEHLFKMLGKLDPERAKTIDRHNKRRLIRALEIMLATNKPISKAVASSKYHVVWLGIKIDKEKLAKRIKNRLDKRLGQGMIEEVEQLHNPPAGGGISWKRLDDFGLEYRWVSRWLIQNVKIKMQNDPFDMTQGHPEQSRTDDNAKLKKFKNSEYYKSLLKEIIKYSKRQMTWFKKNKEIHWIKDDREVSKLISNFMGKRILLARKNKKTE